MASTPLASTPRAPADRVRLGSRPEAADAPGPGAWVWVSLPSDERFGQRTLVTMTREVHSFTLETRLPALGACQMYPLPAYIALW